MANADIAQKVTDELLALLEAGVAPWQKPWAGGDAMPYNALTRRRYRGVNVFILWAAEMRLKAGAGGWLTYRQAEAAGGHVRKGEKGTPIVFWKLLAAKDDETRMIPLLRYFTVFHVSQCDGLALPAIETPANVIDAIEAADALVDGYRDKPTIGFGGPRAYYAPKLDHIQMPPRDTFASAAGYYATLFHELAHSTGHESRLARQEIRDIAAFGDESYSTEELTAEMASSFCCARAGLGAVTMPNAAAYLKHWLTALKAEPRMLITAAARAQRAFDYMTGETPSDEA